ncbi:MAG: class I SAM-dependent methyltransferase [Ignavibacteriales bacterium]|nr:class I SAM-dependent methyltransferase [Ignavibacteriales bacterium]
MAVLDVGCGTGVHLELYRRFECSLFGIDTSESMLDVAKKRLGEVADLKLANACVMPFKDGSFDLVISMLVLHEMDQASRPRAIDEMKRVLKEDGRILLIDFHTGPYHFPRGWLTKFVIFVSEIAAGRRHFRNYRNFMSIRGLSTLVETNKLIVEQEKAVSGGGLVLYLLRKN